MPQLYIKYCWLVLCFVLLLTSPHRTIAQQQPGTSGDGVVRVSVDLVQLDAQVLDNKTHQPVGSLSKDDFELYEDGVPQKIAELSRDQLPLFVVLLFDLTFSVQPVLKPLAAEALQSLEHLKPEDGVAVMVYSASTQLVQDFTTDRAQTVAAIGKASEMQSEDAALFNEAIFEAAEHLGKTTNPRSRRTIIWLTDNVPNIPSEKVHSEQEAFREVFETGTVVSSLLERSAASDFFIATFSKNPMFAPLRAHNPPGDVHRYAERTGGEVMKSSKQEVSTKLAQLIDDIRTRYTIGYYPSVTQPKGKFCEIKLQVKPEIQQRKGRMRVRTKQGYYR
jgi:Ca-activated chloride channel family protein